MNDLRQKAYQSLGNRDYDRALSLFRQLINEDKNDPQVYNGLGMTFAQQGQWHKAARVFKLAYKLDPEASDIYCNYLQSLYITGRIIPALKLMSKKEVVVPYELGTRIMRDFASSKTGRKLTRKAYRLESFFALLTTLGIKPNKDLVTSYIFANSLFPEAMWREKSLDHSEQDEIDKWVSWNNLEYITDYLDQGKGIILVHSHFTMQRISTVLLAKMGYKITSMEYKNWLAEFGIQSSCNVESIEMNPDEGFYLKQVYQAKKALMNGRILQIAGDGYQGSSQVSVKFNRRKRIFKTGFAELAIASDTPALPIFCITRPSGKIDIKIYPPIESGGMDMQKDEKIKCMVVNYAAILEKQWKLHPENLTYQHIIKYLNNIYLAGKQKKEKAIAG